MWPSFSIKLIKFYKNSNVSQHTINENFNWISLTPFGASGSDVNSSTQSRLAGVTIRKSYDAHGYDLQQIVHSYTQSGTQTSNRKLTDELDRMQDAQIWIASRLFASSCHSKAAMQKAFLHKCQRSKKQVIVMLITWRFKETLTKEHASRQGVGRLGRQEGV